MQSFRFVSGLVVSAAVIGSILVSPAAAKRKPPPPPPPPPPSTSSTYVKSYANVLDGVRCDVTAEAVQATSDGGSVALALSSCRGLSWVVKADALGRQQWQAEVGCFGLPAGGYAYGLALQQTADGGYVVAGGARDCQGNPVCPYLTSIECGLVLKLDATGNVLWARVYKASPTSTVLEDIRRTSDGGFVAVGTFRDPAGDIGSVILKLDSQGIVQWQRLLGPSGRTHALLNDVRQTPDGGYVATGRIYTANATGTGFGVLVVRLGANGDLAWQRGYNTFEEDGEPSASEHAQSIVVTPDGGYLVAGNWTSALYPGTCCQGALLLKLDANGNSQWQKAYSRGIHCSYYAYCSAIGGIAYSVHQTSDGGYSFAGAGHLVLGDSAPLVPWLAKTDANGNLLWQHFYWQGYPGTGSPLSQYFASSTLTNDGGFLSVGFTESPVDFKGDLFAVRTDSGGLVGGCSQIRPASPVDVVNPGLVAFATPFPFSATAPVQSDLPGRTLPTSISSTGGQC